MRRHHRAVAILLAGVCVFAGSLAAFSQPAPGTAQTQNGATAPALPPAAPEENPFLARQPTSADEAFSATLLMLDLGRPQLARQYLQKALEFIGEDDAQLLALREKHPATVFLRLARTPALQPLSTELLERSNRALVARRQDPRHLDGILDGLAGTPEQQANAIVALEGIGTAAVPRMLQRLGADRGAIDRDVLAFAFVRMGRDLVPPLIAAIDSPDPAVQRLAIDSLGWLLAEEAIPRLWHPALAAEVAPEVRDVARKAISRIEAARGVRIESVTDYNAAQRLKERALALFSGQVTWPTDEEGLVSIWTWSPAESTVATTRMTPQAASMFTGLGTARQLLAINPSDRVAQSLVTAFALGWEALKVGWDQALPHGAGTAHDLAVLAGPAPLADAVAISLKHGNTLAALAALQTYSEIAPRDELTARPGFESPVLAALNFPDSRVQFAAAAAVVRLQPLAPFPDSHRVVEIFARALTDDGTPDLLVIDPNEARGVSMAAFIAGLGFRERTVQSGREGFRTAAERGDVDLIAIHVNSIDWELTPTIVNLRADARTAAIPIVIYGPETVAGAVQKLIERYSLVTFVIEGVQAEFVQDQVRPFVERLVAPPLTPEQRAERSAAAAYWLATIARGPAARLFDLSVAETALADALFAPGVSENALLALAAIPTPSAQLRLSEAVTNPTADAAIRSAAALQLAAHIRRHGLLIPDRQIAALRQAWNETTDPGLQSTLAVVLGTLRPNAELSAERLLRIPPPIPPIPPIPPMP